MKTLSPLENLLNSSSFNFFVPGYLGIMVTRQKQYCCIFAVTKDNFDCFLKKLFHSSTSHTYHHNSSLFLSRHKSFKRLKQALLFVKLFAHLLVSRSWSMSLKKYKRGVLKLNEKYFFF